MNDEKTTNEVHNLHPNAALWGLPSSISKKEFEQLKNLLLMMNSKVDRGYDLYYTNKMNVENVIKLASKGENESLENTLPLPLRFLSLMMLRRTTIFPYPWQRASKTMSESWFVMDAPLEHMGVVTLRERKGTFIKSLLAAGCPGVLLLAKTWNGSQIPSYKEAAEVFMNLALTCPQQACTSILNSLDDGAFNKKDFREAIVNETRNHIKSLWLEKEGITNETERRALKACDIAFKFLAKKKAMPKDLESVVNVVKSKKICEEIGEDLEYSESQLKRMKLLIDVAFSDDVELFSLIVSRCGIGSVESFEKGVPTKFYYHGYSGKGKFWGSKMASLSAFKCAAHLFDLGENPWTCAGDRNDESNKDGNPFSWIIEQCRVSRVSEDVSEDYSVFALAAAKAAVRDAETRYPGEGLSHCLEMFEESIKKCSEWKSQAGAAALAACERVLLPVMLSGGESDLEPMPENSVKKVKRSSL